MRAAAGGHAVARSRPKSAPVRPAVARVLVDSGPLLALFNGADDWHAPVLRWLRENQAVALITTWAVLTEVCVLLARRIANAAALDFLRWVQSGAVEVDLPSDVSLGEVLAICRRFDNLPFDLADASVAEAAARRAVRHVLTIDSDFDVYRDRAGRALVSVLHDS